MRSFNILAVVLVTASALAACGKSVDEKVSAAQISKTPSTSSSSVEREGSAGAPARPAKFDPNLRANNVVWDSPQKKQEWEAKHAARYQAERARALQAQTAGQQPQALSGPSYPNGAPGSRQPATTNNTGPAPQGFRPGPVPPVQGSR